MRRVRAVSHLSTIRAQTLLDLLRARHTRDVFVSECKDGPTWNCSHNRLDAWAMNRSWAHARTFGYEIKVARQDFLNDTKWDGYLRYCNVFYFVAPNGVIDPNELPPAAGLLVCSTNAKILMVRKQAAYRDVQIPEDFWRYIVMCRAKIIGQDETTRERPIEFWRQWLAERMDLKEVGHRVSRALSTQLRTRVDEVDAKQRALESENQRLAEVKAVMDDLGLTAGTYWRLKEEAGRRLKHMLACVPVGLDEQLGAVARSMNEVRDRLRALAEQAHVEPSP